MIRDCHAHSTWSDGDCAIADVRARAEARGVAPSVTDHVSGDVNGAVDSPERFEDYLVGLESETELGRGAEFCWHDPLWRELDPSAVARLTHRIGSLHAVYLPDGQLIRAFAHRLPDTLSPQEYLRAHVANAESLCRTMPVDILAHPTLIPRPFRSLPPEEVWDEELEARLCVALHRAAIAFEISNRYRPHERLVRRAVAEGCRISLGSDGHRPEQVADLDFPLAMARAAGVADEDLYDPVRDGRLNPQTAAA